MFLNYLKTALRNMARRKGYTFINITGLAIGMACCIFIMMYVNFELSYDSYNEKADRIFRVVSTVKFGEKSSNFAVSNVSLSKNIIQECPEVESTARLRSQREILITFGKKHFKECSIVYSDPNFFKIFSIPLLKKNTEYPLNAPFTVTLSRSTAKKYFGNENPLGKVLKVYNFKLNCINNYSVTGIFENIPPASHFDFDIIFSLSSLKESFELNVPNQNYYTYILLKKNKNIKALINRFPILYSKYLANILKKIVGIDQNIIKRNDPFLFQYDIQPVRSIHLYSNLIGEFQPNGDIAYVYLFSTIAIFILLIASINFINLSTSRSVSRRKEIRIRMAFGVFRSQLFEQFLIESLLFCTTSMLIALVIIEISLMLFYDPLGKLFPLSEMITGKIFFFDFLITFIAVLLTGVYPAFFFSSINPILTIKRKLKPIFIKNLFRNGLVVFQFSLSITLIICTLVVISQLNFVQTKKLGFNRNQLIIIKNSSLLGNKINAFKTDIEKNPQINNVTICSNFPDPSYTYKDVVYPDKTRNPQKIIRISNWKVDSNFISFIGIKIIRGRSFSEMNFNDKNAVVINESLAKNCGWNNPIDRQLEIQVSADGKTKAYNVIGVVEDFHFESFREPISPLMMVLHQNEGKYMIFRVKPGNLSEAIDDIKAAWNRFLPGEPFEYDFLDKNYYKIYEKDERTAKILGAFAFLAIFIACLGLFGLVTFVAEQRTKEIGIRKVLGASVSSIVRLLCKEFLILVGIANLIAWPIAYVIMNRWLNTFAYHVSFSPWIFIAAGLISLIIAFLTISYRAIKTALADPVKSLRYE